MIDKLFLVATEFKFEAGSALLASQQVQAATNSISNSVNHALTSVQQFGIGIAQQFGIAQLGIAGLLHESLSVSDKFRQIQLKFASGIAANKDNLVGPVQTFNEQLQVSGMLMTKLGQVAREFSLDETALMNFSALINPMLMSKGLAGDNFKNTVDISRGVLKSAPVLGVDPYQIQNQLQEIIEGRAGGQNTLFSRLSNDVDVFKKGGAATATAFNAQNAAKRVELLNKALAAFSNQTDIVNAAADTLTGQMRRIATLITGPVSSVLLPLGNLLQTTLKPIIKAVGDYIDKEGRSIIESATKFLAPFAQNLERTYVTFKQFAALKTDVALTAKIGSLIAAFSVIKWLLGMFGISMGFTVSFSAIGSTLMGIGKAARWAAPFLGMIGTLLVRMFWWVPIVLGSLQLISRGKAIADVANAKMLAGSAPAYLKEMTSISNSIQMILRPFTWLWETMAEGVSWIFRLDGGLWVLTKVLSLISSIMRQVAIQAAMLQAVWEAAATAIFYAWDRIMKGQFKNLGSDLMNTFTFDAQEAFKKNMSLLNDPEANMTASMITNINGGVHISNQFKEQMEPDRIAFTLRDQLLSAARNPTQPKGGTIRNTGSRQ